MQSLVKADLYSLGLTVLNVLIPECKWFLSIVQQSGFKNSKIANSFNGLINFSRLQQNIPRKGTLHQRGVHFGADYEPGPEQLLQ